ATCALVATLVIGGARSSANSNTTDARAESAAPTRARTVASPEAVNAAHAVAVRAEGGAPSAPAQAAAAPPPGTEGCSSSYCHGNTEPMHATGDGKLTPDTKDRQGLTCTRCHGGNPAARPASDSEDEKKRAQLAAHVRPRHPELWEYKGKRTTANPERVNAAMNLESWEYVRFINPGDLRVTQKTCGECHQREVDANETSSMRHGEFLWGAALYNNGGFPLKDGRFGESYSPDGYPERLIQVPQPTLEQQLQKGWLTFVDPIPRWEISEPGNILRVFERGDKGRLDVGLPEKDEDPGKPRKGLSARGL